MSVSQSGQSNWSIKEEIRDYWSGRAETFDDSPGHRIDDRYEAAEWLALFRDALGDLAGKQVLDAACGTGEISRMLLAMGAEVTAIDFAEPMMERARRKHQGRPWKGRIMDAETLTGEPDGFYDAIATRHLVWTLVDAAAAFRSWHRVLKPGGRLLVVDGDWSRRSYAGRILRYLASRLAGDGGMSKGADRARHEAILKQVSYATGLSPQRLTADLSAAGFVDFRQHDVRSVYRRGQRGATLAHRLRLAASHRFAISAAKPE